MATEKAGYRENLALLNARFPDKDMLNRDDVAAFMGLSRRSRVIDRLSFNKTTRLVSKSDLARQVSA